jgi:hypothetical protein
MQWKKNEKRGSLLIEKRKEDRKDKTEWNLFIHVIQLCQLSRQILLVIGVQHRLIGGLRLVLW